MVYHAFRTSGMVPINQIGMNVKMRIFNPISTLFNALDSRKHPNFRGGFEPIPDVCLFSPKVRGDWRRRNRMQTLESLLMAIEIKASERANGRLREKELIFDIQKLNAHRQESNNMGHDFIPIMMIIDTAPDSSERITFSTLDQIISHALEHKVGLAYFHRWKQC